MAGRGPAPKQEGRRNKTAPQRGEWIDLPPLEQSVLPDLPEGEWSDRTYEAWGRWREDPATTQYDPADIQNAIDLAYLYEAWVREPTAALAGEIRQRQDRLGLNPKGKRDLRWRVVEKADEKTAGPKGAKPKGSRERLGHLSVVK